MLTGAKLECCDSCISLPADTLAVSPRWWSGLEMPTLHWWVLLDSLLCIHQFPWCGAFVCCLFLQGNWSSFWLKRDSFWQGRCGLGTRKKWIMQGHEVICVQEIVFCYQMPWAHHQCWHLLSIHLWPFFLPSSLFFHQRILEARGHAAVNAEQFTAI